MQSEEVSALCPDWSHVFITVFIIGPLFTSTALSDYFASPMTGEYLKCALLKMTYQLPGVLTEGTKISASNPECK
ncbi:MAG: hypothetical protein WCP73_01735 [Eubacteriales bacterium]